MHRIRAALAVLTVLAVVGCSDNSVPGSRLLSPSGLNRFTSGYPDIDSQILELFPTGLETAAGVQWVNVTNKLAAGDHATAEKMFWALVDWMLKKSGRLQDPTGPLTSLQALNKLVGDMYAIVFPNAPRPPVSLNGDATIGLVQPNEATTIVTPTHHAGVSFLAGSVAEPTLVVIDQNPTIFGTTCGGPLSTTLCQYPLFYRFEEFPHVRLLKEARFAVCHVNTGTFAPPEGIHDRFRLAHDAPTLPTPGSTLVEGIEILPLVDVSDFMTCDNVSYQVASTSRNPLIRGGLAAVNGLLGVAHRVFSPKTAYAIDRGGGGGSFEFSNFNVVDPIRPPTIDFETFLDGSSTSPTCDAACDLTTQYANKGITFDFIRDIDHESLGHATMMLSTNDPAGTPTHQAMNAIVTGEGGGFFDGTIVMRVNNPTTVSFLLRVNNTAPAVPINAFGPQPLEGAPPQLPESQVTRSNAIVYPANCTDCVQFRQETITITNPQGISRIELVGGIYLLMVDDITIVNPAVVIE